MLAVTLSLAVGLLPTGPSAVAMRAITAPAAARAALIRCQEAATAVTDPKIESACGFDYIPLLTALQSGEFREADQLTRDALITLAGDKAVARGFVYFTEVPKLPVEDMATLQRLWYAYSGGKWGYAVQAQAFNQKKVARVYDRFFDRIGWKNKETGSLLRWLPEAKGDEFIYDLEKSPKGHLPLTSTLRGTQLLEGLMDHPAWELEEFADVSF